VKIFVLSKRQYMGKDLLDDRFGRFWELPLELAMRGHEVQGIALSYRAKKWPSADNPISAANGKLTWHSVNLQRYGIPAVRSYVSRARQISKQFKPDIIWACSDAFHAILGRKMIRQSETSYVIDLYDNFESYPATNLPGVLRWFQRAVQTADALTCVSQQLADYVSEQYRSSAPILILENAVRTELFRPMVRSHCRRQLNLPPDAKIIGTAGALYRSRGIGTLYRAFKLLAAEDQTAHLAVAGPRGFSERIPANDRVHDLGCLPPDQIPFFWNALDVAVVCNRDSSFGRYNFPQKVREIMACEIPLVAADIGTMKELLREHPECLFAPDDPTSLARALRIQIRNPRFTTQAVPSWADMAGQLEAFFIRTLRQS